MKRTVFLLTKVRRTKWRGSHPPVVVDTILIIDRVALLVMQIKVCIYYVQIIIGKSGITLEQCPGFHHLLSLDVLVPLRGTTVGVVCSQSCLLCPSAQVFAWKG